MTYEELLAEVNAALKNIVEEKRYILANSLVFPVLFKVYLGYSQFCDDAIQEISEYLLKLIKETDVEHQIYDKMSYYLYRIIQEQTIEEIEASPEAIFFEETLKALKAASIKRNELLQYYIFIYQTIVETGALTKSNYRIYLPKKPVITKEKYLSILEAIPQK